MKTPQNNFIAFLLFALILLAAISCKKEPKQVFNVVEYHCYSENSAVFKYVDETNTWKQINLLGNSAVISVKIKPENMDFICTLTSTGPDSLYVHAQCSNGKIVQKSFRNLTGQIQLTVPLSDLR